MTSYAAPLHFSENELLLRLRELPGAFFLRDEETSFFGAYPEGGSAELLPPDEPTDGDGPDVPLWIGALPYESFRSLERRKPVTEDRRRSPHLIAPVWCRYSAVGRISGGNMEVFAETEAALRRLTEALFRADSRPGERPCLIPIGPGEPPSLHIARVEAALREIAKGNLYQVNLARRFHFEARGNALSLLAGMGSAGKASFSAALSLGSLQLVSSSPELFLSIDPTGRVETRPIKGTRPRGTTPAEDLSLRMELDGSEKEKAELAMVIDLERNDLGRICVPGSVHVTQLPHVITHATVHHREATVTGQLRPDVSLSEAIRAMSPSGSVTGAPKVSAMDWIAELEAERRGLYTGSLGYRTRRGSLRLSMAIRVLTLRGTEAHYYAGGGIVADSDPKLEVAETEWKAEHLRSLISS